MTNSRPPAPFSGSFTIPELGVERRWSLAGDMDPALIPQVIRLLERSFNGGPLWFNLPVDRGDHIRWKYYDAPEGALVLLTFDEHGRLMGFVGSPFHRWLLRGESHRSADGTDQARDPDWQGQGLSRILRARRDEMRHPEVEFGLAYATHPVDIHIAEANGMWPIANAIQTLERPLGIGPLLPNRLRGTGSSPATTEARSRTAEVIRQEQLTARDRLRNRAREYGYYARSIAGRRPAGSRGFRITTTERFDERFEAFIAVASGAFDFIHERSLAFLNWRYRDARAGSFVVRAVEHGDDVLGYIATRIDGQRARIGDLLVLPNRDDVTAALLEDAISLGRRHGVSTLEMRLAKRHPYRGAAHRAGFVVRRETAGETIETYGDRLPELTLLRDPNAQVHITLGDSDHM
ncbi:MAG: hypothetical protein R3C39_14825 [Dehalococcoidia bacterium]